MALFQPSNVIPDVRSGIGFGVVDANDDLTVSWRINGQSAMVKFQIVIYQNNSASTQLFDTGELTDGCPAYGSTNMGEPQFFSYTIASGDLASAGLTNGGEYKIIITQWWSASESVTQSSASVFLTRDAPALTINAIGTGGVASTRYYTFSGSYTQTQGDVLNWFRWRIAYANSKSAPFYDTGNISGTMDISTYFDGLFSGADYSVRLTAQTENGVEADTGWIDFSVSYSTPEIAGHVIASCAEGTDSVYVELSGIASINGTPTGTYSISDDYLLTLSSGSSVTWDTVNEEAMSFSAPWSVVWRGKITNADAPIFTIGQADGDLTLRYENSSRSIVLSKNGVSLASQGGMINTPTITVILTASALYIRSEYAGGGMYPALTLYPGTGLYPAADTIEMTDIYTISVSYTQGDITSFSLGGYQVCEYVEVINGNASPETIAAAITDGDYTPGISSGDYMMADWTNGLDAGNLNVGGDTIIGFAIYRRQDADSILRHVADIDYQATELYDYGAVSGQGPYTYYAFPIGASTYIASSIASNVISPCWWNWTLLECAETDTDGRYEVLAAYRFRNNIESGTVSNNNSPTVLHNFTPYPTVQLSPQNYKSGTLAGLIGAVSYANGQPEYSDTISLRDAIYALSVSQNALFLKNRKGDLLRIRISGPVAMTTADNTRQQAQTMSLPWVEVGSADGVSLYATESKAVTP